MINERDRKRQPFIRERGTLNFEYDSHGNQTKVKRGGYTLAAMTYDACGRQRTLKDVNAGTIRYIYNAYGELVSQKEIATGKLDTLVYDALGRLLKGKNRLVHLSAYFL